MATNNRPLKAFIRYDGSGRAVSSSLIWRKNKPKVGNWKEVQGYECCNPEPGPTFTPIELCYGDNPCNGDCTVDTYYIYYQVIGGVNFPKLLKSENPTDYAGGGLYKFINEFLLMTVGTFAADQGDIDSINGCT